jgi:hypothetical protein
LLIRDIVEDAAAFGYPREKAEEVGYKKELDIQVETMALLGHHTALMLVTLNTSLSSWASHLWNP